MGTPRRMAAYPDEQRTLALERRLLALVSARARRSVLPSDLQTWLSELPPKTLKHLDDWGLLDSTEAPLDDAAQCAVEVKKKGALPLFLFCLLLGPFGVHRFYAGRIVTGVLMLILTLSAYGLIVSVPWWIVDLVLILVGLFRDRHGNKIGW